MSIIFDKKETVPSLAGEQCPDRGNGNMTPHPVVGDADPGDQINAPLLGGSELSLSFKYMYNMSSPYIDKLKMKVQKLYVYVLNTTEISHSIIYQQFQKILSVHLENLPIGSKI